MITLRPSAERGHADHGWLETFHSFSFADYHDPEQMGFRALRVINDDIIEPGKGFGTHGHREMEIVTYVIEGALEHQDSTGSTSVLHAGEAQRMSAGTGIQHSEYNASKRDPVRLLQIWVLPGQRGLEPGYENRKFGQAERRGELRLFASPNRRDGSLAIHQDVEFHASILEPGEVVRHALAPGRGVWIQVVTGSIKVNGDPLGHGDGAAIEDEATIRIEALEDSEFLLIDLACNFTPPAEGAAHTA